MRVYDDLKRLLTMYTLLASRGKPSCVNLAKEIPTQITSIAISAGSNPQGNLRINLNATLLKKWEINKELWEIELKDQDCNSSNQA